MLIDDVKAAVATLKTDTSTGLKDIADKIAALSAGQTDPALTADLNSILSDVQALDAQIKAADPGPATQPVVPSVIPAQ